MGDAAGVGGVPARRTPADYAVSGRRAVRVTLEAVAGFYLFRYGLDRPVAATYALFASVALGGLAKIPGSGRQRAATVLRLLPVCWLLVVVGTFLSVRTWCAVVGMLAVGFALAFAAVGGPRPAGAAPGLQLLYILPSFPPYAPGTLTERLIGTSTGLALFIVAEALILPEPNPPSYRERAAHAVRTAAHCAALLAAPPYALTGPDIRAAWEAGRSLRFLTVPEAERPAGPGVRDRALSHTGLATRALLTRLAQLPVPPGGQPGPEATAVLQAVVRLATATADCLGTGPSPSAPYEDLVRARAHLSAVSGGPVPAGDVRPGTAGAPDFPPAVLRRDAAVLEIADAALTMATAADVAVRGRHAAVQAAQGRFWYAETWAPLLWWHRLRGHAGRRSVFFQNAVRIALALTAARLVAGVGTLPHGFWAMLATLTLTRTTMDETWHTIRLALAGTLAGALVTAGVLSLAGSNTAVYAVVLPVWMLFGFTVGPVKGVGWAQGLFTVLVALVFAQLSPPTWRLAEARVLDVLVGSAIGVVFGLLAWPRGAHDELRHAAAELLRRAAEIVVATGASVAAGDAVAAPSGGSGHRSLHSAVVLAESAYAQFQSEPTPFGGAARRPAARSVDWQATLMAGHHTLWGSQRLLEPPLTGLDPVVADSVSGLGDRVAGRMLLISAALDPGADTPTGRFALFDPRLVGSVTEPPGAPCAYYATVSWLDSLMTDLTRIARGSPEPGQGPDAS
ncbi:FUSC family protein [Streptomyces barringtoniae]|uniref:FUSC family protein n=1 Tax=Streptomyces barringtoniae TaxID=2892029 RepID=UPI001E4B3215|nr:FUSC family protein [Streptomyces barringtoniae]MCC5477754.1 FUSC family protein [Streptomyces barringtoniae]